MSGQSAPITAIVLASNEAQHIGPCLRTLQWTVERVVVLDDRGTHGMREEAQALGARVLSRKWDHWVGQRTFALSQATQPWVLFVDVDERVPLDLAEECWRVVGEASSPDSPIAGFWIPRQNLIMGHWVRHAGWYPDYQLRLFRTSKGRYDPSRQVHELVQLDGTAEHLSAHLVHHNYVSWRQFWTKQRLYGRTEARQLLAQGVRAKPRNFILQPLREFRRRYWTLEGWRAGPIGLQLSLVLAAANFAMYADLFRAAAFETRKSGRPG